MCGPTLLLMLPTHQWSILKLTCVHVQDILVPLSLHPSLEMTTTATLYNKTLWNSEGPMCSVSATCCENPDQPWFKKKLDAPVGDNIELRWCANEDLREGTATERVELYIRVG